MGSAAVQADVATHLSDASLRQMLSVDTFLVAEVGGSMIGFVQVGSVNPDYEKHLDCFDNAADEVKRLYILRAHQNRGLGTELLQRGLAVIGKSSSVYITTWEANRGAQRLYERFGFSKVGQIPEYGRDDAVPTQCRHWSKYCERRSISQHRGVERTHCGTPGLQKDVRRGSSRRNDRKPPKTAQARAARSEKLGG